jgi:hypothetical protein
MKFEFQALGVQEANARFHGAGDRAGNLRPAFSKIADEWISSERRQFASKRGWAPNRPSTKARKLRQGYGLTVMRQTGALERALTIRRSRGQTIRLQKHSMSMGLKPNGPVFYGKFQARYGRKVVVFDPKAEATVEPTIHDYIIHGSRTLRGRALR